MLDNLDRKILQSIEEDSRQSNANIARMLKTNKTIVNYRIERMQKQKIITGYTYIANQVILGKLSFGLLLQFRDLTASQECDLIKKFEKIDQVSWSALINGRWDMIVVVIEKDIHSFNDVLSKIFSLCEDHIKEYNFYVDYAGSISGHDYLYSNPKGICVKYSKLSSGKEIDLKNTELDVYNLLKRDPRMSLLSIAEKLGKTYDTIKSKFNYLQSEKILLRCSPIINIKLLGYQDTLCLFNLSPSSDRINELLKFCEKHPNILRYSNCLGHFNLILSIHSTDNMHLKEIIGKIKENFSDIINSYEIIQTTE
jgi:Lrp/AsnC family leucine-responsive transcriptional regulator